MNFRVFTFKTGESPRNAVPERFKGFPIFAWSFCIGPANAKFYEGQKAGGT